MNNKFVLFYVKDNVMYPIKISQGEFDLLQVVVPSIFEGKEITIIDQPLGKVKNLVSKKSL